MAESKETTEPDLAMAKKHQDMMGPDLTAEEGILDTTESHLTVAETLLDTMEPDPLTTHEASASERPPDEASPRHQDEALKTSGRGTEDLRTRK